MVGGEMVLKTDKRVRFQSGEKHDGIYRELNLSNIDDLKVFSEDIEPSHKKILDPSSDIRLKWNHVFLISSLVALIIDPMYFYLPKVSYDNSMPCVYHDQTLNKNVTILRTLSDLFYVLNIVVKFRTGYIAPSSRILGRGEIVKDPYKIALKYLKKEFLLDLFVALPLPQIAIWSGIPAFKNYASGYSNTILGLVIMIQYLPRLYLIFPLTYKIIVSAITKTAWVGAACNLIIYIIGCHVSGASWYLLTAVRQITCWKIECSNEADIGCTSKFLDCSYSNTASQQIWANKTQVFLNCDVSNTNRTFQYGIFQFGLSNAATSADFTRRLFFGIWWGVLNLSSFCQNLTASLYVGETTFSILISVSGVVLFAHLIGNMQNYLQSLNGRMEEWRMKKRDTEEWMRRRHLPHDLKSQVRQYNKYKWFSTRGVDEEAILQSLPIDIRRDIQRHLCFDLLRRVPFFSQMDDQLLDAISERLNPSLSIQGTNILQEGYPITEMVFIIRGRLESCKTETAGVLNSIMLGPGDFCGDELLTWALNPKSKDNFPTSTRTVRAVVESESFALGAEDIKDIANKFRRLHSKKFQHTFRFYSQEWRTWAACLVQAAWRRCRRRRGERGEIKRPVSSEIKQSSLSV